MNASVKPRLQLLEHSRLDTGSYQSLLMSATRGMAALQVAAAHLRREFFPGLSTLEDPSEAYVLLAFVTGFSHQAVIAFFLISGWLVGGSLLDKIAHPNAFTLYAIDRITRLWTVLLPTLLLTLVFGLVTGAIDPHAFDFSVNNDYSGAAFFGTLLGVQNVTVLPFGDNYALWSLANETWYYLMFPLALATWTAKGSLRRVFAVVCIALAAAFVPGPILLYFVLWLLGTAFSRIRIYCSNGTRVLLLLVAAAVGTYYRLTGINDGLQSAAFVQDLIFGIAVVLFLSSMHNKVNPHSIALKRVRTVAEVSSEFSFSLYVLHVPLLYVLLHLAKRFGTARLSPDQPLDYALYFIMLGAVLACSYLSYLLFESHTYKIRGLVKQKFLACETTTLPAKGGRPPSEHEVEQLT